MNACYWKTVLFGTVSILSGIATKFCDIIIATKQSDTIDEVLLYGTGEEGKKQTGLNNLFCIYYVLGHASQTIDVCVPSLESDTISKCLAHAHENDIRVRIIMHKNVNTNFKYFLDCGIEVRVRSAGVQMEYEFILIDAVGDCKDALTIIGSLDYTVTRVNCNRDSTLLISEQNVVLTFKTEFDRIWDSI